MEPAEINVVIYGDPKAQKRHRSWSRNGIKGTYDPSSGDKADFLAQCLKSRPINLIEDPIILYVDFYFPRPKSHYGTGKNSKILKPSAPKYHTNKPDIDNLIKFIQDAGNRFFWKDDSQIYLLIAGKYYNQTPRTEIKMRTT